MEEPVRNVGWRTEGDHSGAYALLAAPRVVSTARAATGSRPAWGALAPRDMRDTLQRVYQETIAQAASRAICDILATNVGIVRKACRGRADAPQAVRFNQATRIRVGRGSCGRSPVWNLLQGARTRGVYEKRMGIGRCNSCREVSSARTNVLSASSTS